MKKPIFTKLLAFAMLLFVYSGVIAQLPEYTVELRNAVQTAPNQLEFDIYLTNTGAVPFELALAQYGILPNPAIKNGGTMTAVFVAGSSELPTTHQPGSIQFHNPTNSVRISSNTPSENYFVPPTPGVRVVRVRLTNSVPFLANSTPDLTFSFTSPPYNTVIAAYIGVPKVNTVITDQSYFFNLTGNDPLNPTCDSPTNLFVSNITASTADLHWTGGSLWNVEVGLTGFTPGTSNQVTGIVGTTQNPWTATGLNFTTNTYEFYVQSNCGGLAGLSDWAGPYAIACQDYMFPTVADICDGDSYTWRGNTYTIGGIYYDSLVTTNPSGCDSIYMLTLTVNPTYEFVTNAQICQGQSYSWNGNTYTVGGTYNVNHLTQQGCDSIYILNLTVNPTYLFSTNAGICNGEIYTWRGNDYSVAGTYYDSLTTALGCDSVYMLSLAVHPTYEFLTNATICDDASYFWRGNIYNVAGMYYDSLVTAFGCDSIYVLNLTVNPTYEFETDAEICDGDTYNWRGNDYTVAGTYYDSLSTALGCDSIYVLNLTVNDLPLVSIIGLDNFYCEYNDAVTMTGSPAGGTFSGPGVTGNVFDPAAAGLGTHPVVYTYTDGNGCTNTATINVEVDECLSVIAFDEHRINVYPNPVDDLLTIEIQAASSGQHIWNLYSVNGQLIASGRQEFLIGLNQISIETNSLSAGLYLLQTNLNGHIQNFRIVKN